VHELAVTESLLEIALRYGNQAEATRITDLHIVIGQLSSIIDNSVQFYWDIVAKETIAEGATLHFKRLPVKFQCLDCKTVFLMAENQYDCTNCHSQKLRIISGDEFLLEFIEVETK
jgi:hydrogenase nickel incorporation protein HypA/HybF